MSTRLIHIIGYPGAGKTTAMNRLIKGIKKRGGSQRLLHSGNTKRNFKKQQIPIMATCDRQVAMIGKDPVNMPAHRKRLSGTESLGIFQRNMIDRAFEALSDQKYKNVVIDGFCMMRPAPQKAVKRLQKRNKMHYHVLHLKTPYEVATESWWARERKSAQQGHQNAIKAVARNTGRDECAKKKLFDERFDVFYDMADQVTEVTRDNIDDVIDDMIWQKN